jgi:hypothetical protein
MLDSIRFVIAGTEADLFDVGHLLPNTLAALGVDALQADARALHGPPPPPTKAVVTPGYDTAF